MATNPRMPPGPVDLQLAAILREARARLNLSQRDIAARTGISQQQLSLFLRGQRSPNVAELAALCMALQLDIVATLTEATSRSRSTTLPPGVARENRDLRGDADG